VIVKPHIIKVKEKEREDPPFVFRFFT